MGPFSFFSLPTEMQLSILSLASRWDLQALRLVSRKMDTLTKPLLFRFRHFSAVACGHPSQSDLAKALACPEYAATLEYIQDAVVEYGDYDQMLLNAISHRALTSFRLYHSHTWDPSLVDPTSLVSLLQSQPYLRHLELKIHCDTSKSQDFCSAVQGMTRLRSLVLELDCLHSYGEDYLEEQSLYEPTLNTFRQMLKSVPSLEELRIDVSQTDQTGLAVTESIFRNLEAPWQNSLTKLLLTGLIFGDGCNGLFQSVNFERLSALSIENCPGSSEFLGCLSSNCDTLSLQHFAFVHDVEEVDCRTTQLEHRVIIQKLSTVLSKTVDLQSLYVHLVGEAHEKLLPPSCFLRLEKLRDLYLVGVAKHERNVYGHCYSPYDYYERRDLAFICGRK